MMRRIATLVLLLSAAAAHSAFAVCGQATLRAFSNTNISIGEVPANTDGCAVGTPAAGDPVSIKAGGETIATTVIKYSAGITTSTATLRGILQLASVDPAPEKLQLINNETTVSVTIGQATFDARVLSPTPNYFRYRWSVGPATSGDPNGGGSGSSTSSRGIIANDTTGSGSTSTSDSAGAIRIQYSAQYANSGMFGTKVGTAETVATIDIDTTDQNDTSFIDNNKATLGFQWNLPPAGNVLKQATVGFAGSAAKSFHQDIHDIDATVNFSGWLPIIHTLNIFNREGQFISAPLSFTTSYGYRNREQSGDTFHGRVFEATALYHIFAADRYKLDLAGDWTVNDLSNRPSTIPRTQRMYKATISYLADPSRGFSLLTSFEDGSAGVMLTKVRQYFVGLAVAKINFSGGRN
jgi:hypothetical protein